MKKFINNVADVENEMIQGFVKAYPQYVRKLDAGNILVRNQKSENKVAVITGGGSGHEPGHCGYVGEGMLDAFVAGAVFTSPTPDMIYEAIKATATEKGVLLSVMNYTGDVMNFEMASEMADADGIRTETVIINDDVAVKDSTWTSGRRGVAGSFFLNKLAGAKAETGADLDEVKALAEKAVENIRTMGAAISPCTVPAAGKPGFEIGEDEIEIGMGVHGEPGTYRDKMKSANEIADILLDKILADIDFYGREVAVMVNSSGATPLMELYIINNRIHDYLTSKGISIYRTFCGEFMTSIDMAGFSITLLRLDDELKYPPDARASTPVFTR